jgi:hypothetical protein
MENPKLFERDPLEKVLTKGGYLTDITLLDLFAGMAMVGLLGSPSMVKCNDKTILVGEKDIAASAYNMARFMLKERETVMKKENK